MTDQREQIASADLDEGDECVRCGAQFWGEHDCATATPERADLDAIQARVDAATPGPWTMKREATAEFDLPKDGGHVECWVLSAEALDLHSVAYLFEGEPDAEFIAHARSDIPALLADLRTAEDERDLYGEALDLVRAHLATVGIEAPFVDDAAALAVADLRSSREREERLMELAEKWRDAMVLLEVMPPEYGKVTKDVAQYIVRRCADELLAILNEAKGEPQ